MVHQFPLSTLQLLKTLKEEQRQETPGDGQTPQEGNPLYPLCSIDSYTAALNDYRRLAELSKEYERQVEEARTAATAIKNKDWITRFYDAEKINIDGVKYVIRQGYSDYFGHINKPKGAKIGRKKISKDTSRHTTGDLYDKSKCYYTGKPSNGNRK